MKTISCLPAILFLFLIGCTSAGNTKELLLSDDGVRIAYTYTEGKKNTGVILAHMLNRDSHDYDKFSAKLQEQGYSVVSIDFRGHGKSDSDWQKFTSKDFNAMTLDIKAAQDFLTTKGIKQFIVVGASIGANAALKQASQDMTIRGVVLLSPGLEYKGVKTEDAARALKVPALLIASKEDEYSYLSAQKLHSIISTKKQIILYEDAGHGTQMFAKQPLDKIILEWVEQTTSGNSERRSA
ncbi:MAG: alpha/beta fold hydrolase [Candidatus Aenigmarchaeota archaeon]|nr:alpha/beta fold hydrolase [Candidatus Aenigmarchaeota archaeon]